MLDEDEGEGPEQDDVDYVHYVSHHIIPAGDFREHECSPNCWCEPVQEAGVLMIYFHNALDQRELFRTGQRMPC